MAEPATTDDETGIVLRPGKGGVLPPVEHRFGPGNTAGKNGRRGNRPVVPIVSARDLAVPHLQRAIARLAELMEEDGRNANVARAACAEMIKLACPDLEGEALATKVAERLQAMVAEAEALRGKEPGP